MSTEEHSNGYAGTGYEDRASQQALLTDALRGVGQDAFQSFLQSPEGAALRNDQGEIDTDAAAIALATLSGIQEHIGECVATLPGLSLTDLKAAVRTDIATWSPSMKGIDAFPVVGEVRTRIVDAIDRFLGTARIEEDLVLQALDVKPVRTLSIAEIAEMAAKRQSPEIEAAPDIAKTITHEFMSNQGAEIYDRYGIDNFANVMIEQGNEMQKIVRLVSHNASVIYNHVTWKLLPENIDASTSLHHFRLLVSGFSREKRNMRKFSSEDSKLYCEKLTEGYREYGLVLADALGVSADPYFAIVDDESVSESPEAPYADDVHVKFVFRLSAAINHVCNPDGHAHRHVTMRNRYPIKWYDKKTQQARYPAEVENATSQVLQVFRNSLEDHALDFLKSESRDGMVDAALLARYYDDLLKFCRENMWAGSADASVVNQADKVRAMQEIEYALDASLKEYAASMPTLTELLSAKKVQESEKKEVQEKPVQSPEVEAEVVPGKLTKKDAWKMIDEIHQKNMSGWHASFEKSLPMMKRPTMEAIWRANLTMTAALRKSLPNDFDEAGLRTFLSNVVGNYKRTIVRMSEITTHNTIGEYSEKFLASFAECAAMLAQRLGLNPEQYRTAILHDGIAEAELPAECVWADEADYAYTRELHRATFHISSKSAIHRDEETYGKSVRLTKYGKLSVYPVIVKMLGTSSGKIMDESRKFFTELGTHLSRESATEYAKTLRYAWQRIWESHLGYLKLMSYPDQDRIRVTMSTAFDRAKEAVGVLLNERTPAVPTGIEGEATVLPGIAPTGSPLMEEAVTMPTPSAEMQNDALTALRESLEAERALLVAEREAGALRHQELERMMQDLRATMESELAALAQENAAAQERRSALEVREQAVQTRETQATEFAETLDVKEQGLRRLEQTLTQIGVSVNQRQEALQTREADVAERLRIMEERERMLLILQENILEVGASQETEARSLRELEARLTIERREIAELRAVLDEDLQQLAADRASLATDQEELEERWTELEEAENELEEKTDNPSEQEENEPDRDEEAPPTPTVSIVKPAPVVIKSAAPAAVTPAKATAAPKTKAPPGKATNIAEHSLPVDAGFATIEAECKSLKTQLVQCMKDLDVAREFAQDLVMAKESGTGVRNALLQLRPKMVTEQITGHARTYVELAHTKSQLIDALRLMAQRGASSGHESHAVIRSSFAFCDTVEGETSVEQNGDWLTDQMFVSSVEEALEAAL